MKKEKVPKPVSSFYSIVQNTTKEELELFTKWCQTHPNFPAILFQFILQMRRCLNNFKEGKLYFTMRDLQYLQKMLTYNIDWIETDDVKDTNKLMEDLGWFD